MASLWNASACSQYCAESVPSEARIGATGLQEKHHGLYKEMQGALDPVSHKRGVFLTSDTSDAVVPTEEKPPACIQGPAGIPCFIGLIHEGR